MTRIAKELLQLDAALASPHGAPSSDFDLNPEFDHGNVTLKEAAVLIPLIQVDGRLEVVLTRRSKHLKHHPGQIAFPGGKVDPSDRDNASAALREAQEEIGLDPASVSLLGRLDPHRTVTGYSVTPHIGLIEGGFEPELEPAEVDEAFSVPLAFLMDIQNFQIEGRTWMGKRRQYYVVPYGPYYIWGATARMLRALADRMDQTRED